MEGYSKVVLDHFYNPRNVGEIADADGVGEVGNMKCGDVMYVFIRVGTRIKTKTQSPDTEAKTTEEYIEDVKFKTLGCAAAIASSSMMAEMAKGMTVEEAEKLSKDDINKALGILPKQKYHCSILSAEGLRKAIADYKSK
ncbi:MAG TPA: iron-sulfur cluster assembly scaffold protein [bacterium]|nr:iron-sulfur cluster assembly scaffold protein [bacterium]